MSAEEYAGIVDKQIQAYWENIETSWANMADAWRHAKGFWLLGPANYVFRTECLWAVDPMLRQKDAAEKILPRVKKDFAGVRFVLISHLHGDHYNLSFLKELADSGVSLVVPDWISPSDLTELSSTGAEIILGAVNSQLYFDGVRVDILPGYHYDYNRPEMGVPSISFRVTTTERTYLFPGDVRDFEHCRMPSGCDVMFGHVWLGRGCAALEPERTALSRYVQYIRRLRPKHLVLTHLYDLHRKDIDQWTYRHALWIKDALQTEEMKITIPVPGETGNTL